MYFCAPLTDECPFEVERLIRFRGFDLVKSEPGGKWHEIVMSPYDSLPSIANAARHLPVGLRLRSVEFLRRWKHAYSLLEPVTFDLKDLLRDSFDVGIHIRSTDKITSKPGVRTMTELETKAYVCEKLPDLLRSQVISGKRVYIACDSRRFHDLLTSTLGEDFRLYSNINHWVSNRVRETDGETVVRDIFALSRCKIIYSNIGGGVPYTSRLIGHGFSRVILGLKFVSLRTFKVYLFNLTRRLLEGLR